MFRSARGQASAEPWSANSSAYCVAPTKKAAAAAFLGLKPFVSSALAEFADGGELGCHHRVLGLHGGDFKLVARIAHRVLRALHRLGGFRLIEVVAAYRGIRQHGDD